LSRAAPRRRRRCLGGAAAWLVCATGFAAPPPAGAYAAQWCVTLPDAQTACGPARAEWRTPRRALVRISDIVYALQFRGGQLDVTLKQGAMQIDAFSATCEWDGPTLRFVDADKGVRYELRIDAPPKWQAASPAGR
jgi:hypothetical protein